MLLGLAACGGVAQPAPVGDRVAYAAAARHGDPVPCREIGDPRLAGECLTFAAGARAAADPAGAFALCAEVTAAPWAAECPFWVADQLALTGAPAAEACGRAGPYRDHCVYHALARALPGLALPDTIGDEAALGRAISARVDALGVHPGHPAHADAVHNLTARRIAARWADQDFDVGLCGAAPPRLCRRAYRHGLDFAAVDLRALCTAGPSRERVAAAGLRAWTPAGGDLARGAWRDICEPLLDGSGSPRRPGALPPPPGTGG